MESPLAIFAVHWDHELPGGCSAQASSPAISAGVSPGVRAGGETPPPLAAGTAALRFLESPIRETHVCTAPLLAQPVIAGYPLAPGVFPVLLTGEASRSYQIEASTNLAIWIGLGVVASSNGPAHYLDTTATNFDKRFYRARILP